MKQNEYPHKRYNALTGDWILVSPHRSKRPWQGGIEKAQVLSGVKYEPQCYLCPGNVRTSGEKNPDYADVYAFNNDFAALLPEEMNFPDEKKDSLFYSENVRGICRVICFNPRHDLTLAQMTENEILPVIELWKKEFKELAEYPWIKNIQIFENKGEIMGCSNPHPHGQIWAQSDLPVEIAKENSRQQEYFLKNQTSLLLDYLDKEILKEQRIICSNDHFVALVPYWAVWPFESMIISRRHVTNILQFSSNETQSLANILSRLTVKYDNLFQTSFPYSAGMHQAPVNQGEHPEWHWHMHFYPPLLRSATVKKFMVGYELLAGPQRDITPEIAAQMLREQSEKHYSFE